ncbi:MAG: glycosyltransferase family 9 protein [Flavobacteriales bacterium]
MLFANNARILIIQTACLGDVILATSVVNSIKAQYPEAQVDLLVKKGNELLVLGHPNIHRVLTFDKSRKWRDILRLVRANRATRYDFIVNLHRFASSGLIAVLSQTKTIGFDKNPLSRFYNLKLPHPISKGIHEIDRNFTLIAALGVKHLVKPSIVPSEDAMKNVREYQETPYVCFAPASVWATKQLPVEKWVELSEKQDHAIYLLGGASDHSLCETIKTQIPGRTVNLAGNLSLMESIALMKGAVRNYVNDSGPLHFASAVNAPVTAYFCSTVTDFGFGPLSDDSEVKEVTGLACRPCGLHGKKECPEGHFKCGKELVV